MRRRRKTRYTWFPSDGSAVTNGNATFTEELIAFESGLAIVPGADSALPVGAVTSVIADFDRNDENSKNNSLADLMGSEYILKRIVGKIFVELTTTKLGSNPVLPPDLQSALVTAGFFIAPFGTDPTSGTIAQDFPVGQTSPTAIPIYKPSDGVTARQPWIWRRSWLLTAGGNQGNWQSNPATRVVSETTGDILGSGTFPSNNVAYGSVLDGPHIDAKTARRVHKHERLWYSVSAVTAPFGHIIDPDQFGDLVVRTVLDVRCLGALRRQRNRSSFE